MGSKSEYEEEIGAICVLDVLGTKGIWRRDPGKYLETITLLHGLFNPLIEDVKKKITQNLQEHLHTNYQYDSQFRTFSDTIIITSTFKLLKDDSENNPNTRERLAYNLSILGFILITLINSAIQERIYLRGALCVGKIYRKDSIIIGPAIDEAASQYEQSKWIGITLTPNASLFMRIANDTQYSKLIEDLYTQYDVPKKTGVEKSCDVLNWPRFYFNGIRESIEFIKDDLIFRLDESMDYEIYLKYKNTIDFFNLVEKNSRIEFNQYFNSTSLF